MAKFHELCHSNCALRYFGLFLELIKLDFRGLKGQVDVKKAHFMGLFAEIGYLKPILASRKNLWPFVRHLDCAYQFSCKSVDRNYIFSLFENSKK